MYSKGFSDLSFYDGIIRNEYGSVRRSFESINYNYNKSTLIYKLSLLLEPSIAYLEKNNAF